jgi:hypothetical protein
MKLTGNWRMSEAMPKQVMIIDVYDFTGLASTDQFLEH